MYNVQWAENEQRIFVSELCATAVDLRVLEVKKEETAAEFRFDLPRAQLLICQEPNFWFAESATFDLPRAQLSQVWSPVDMKT